MIWSFQKHRIYKKLSDMMIRINRDEDHNNF